MPAFIHSVLQDVAFLCLSSILCLSDSDNFILRLYYAAADRTILGDSLIDRVVQHVHQGAQSTDLPNLKTT